MIAPRSPTLRRSSKELRLASPVLPSVPVRPERRAEQQIFWIALVVRVIVILLLLGFSSGNLNGLSRDSHWYDLKGISKAEDYAAGTIDWAQWIDEGWYEFVGVVYWAFGPHLLAVLLINAVFTAFASVLAYRVATVAFENEAVGRVSALLFTLFPSVVYFTSLPLKEAAALLGHMMAVWGILQIATAKRSAGWLWILGGLAIILALRAYLFVLLSMCAVACVLPWRPRKDLLGFAQVAGMLLLIAAAGLLALELSGVEMAQHAYFRQFDLDYLNDVRNDMSAGKSRLYSSSEEAGFSDNWIDNLWKGLRGLWYFFVVIDVTNIRRERQLGALPEMVFFLYAVLPIGAGILHAWRRDPKRVLPILLWGACLVLVYSGATTNGGAMYRWRVQAMPFLIMLVVYGCWVRRRGVIYHAICRAEALSARPSRPVMVTR